MATFHKILAPTDFSRFGEHAVRTAVQLARDLGAELTLLHAWDVPFYAYAGIGAFPSDMMPAVEDAARQQLASTLEAVRKELPGATSILVQGYPAQQILEAIASTRADLVVMGTHGRRGVPHALLGSVAERVVRSAPVAVLTVHAPAEKK